MNILISKGSDTYMRCDLARTIGISSFTFGAGVLLCLVLPTSALVFVQASLIICSGAALFIK